MNPTGFSYDRRTRGLMDFPQRFPPSSSQTDWSSAEAASALRIANVTAPSDDMLP
ncbi:MAG: hypothetical protein U0414_10885 [Polyangiaceae bacterium]